MVTIRSVAFTSPTRIEQERCTVSLRWIEQAPHCAMPQPYFVPVKPTFSRITHKSGVFGSTSTCCVLPLIVRRIICVSSRGGVGGLTLDRSPRGHKHFAATSRRAQRCNRREPR